MILYSLDHELILEVAAIIFSNMIKRDRKLSEFITLGINIL